MVWQATAQRINCLRDKEKRPIRSTLLINWLMVQVHPGAPFHTKDFHRFPFGRQLLRSISAHFLTSGLCWIVPGCRVERV